MASVKMPLVDRREITHYESRTHCSKGRSERGTVHMQLREDPEGYTAICHQD